MPAGYAGRAQIASFGCRGWDPAGGRLAARNGGSASVRPDRRLSSTEDMTGWFRPSRSGRRAAAGRAKLQHVFSTASRWEPYPVSASRTQWSASPPRGANSPDGKAAGQNSNAHVLGWLGYHAASHPPV